MKLLRKTKRWKLQFVAILGLIFAVVSVMGKKDAPARELEVKPPVAAYARNISGIGVVEPTSEIVAIGTEIGGVIRSVHVKVGDKVKAGAPLFTMDERDIDAQIETLKSSLSATRVQEEDADAQYAIVKSIKDARAVAKDDYNRRKFASQLATARVKETQTKLNQAMITKERLTVKAPLTGEILSLNVRAGEFASAGPLPEPLIRMGDTSTLHVRVEIDEENAALVSPSASAKGTKRGDTASSLPLTFVRFEPYVRPKQNIAVSGQRVDTRVLQVIYAINETPSRPFVGEQMDVFVEQPKENENAK